MRKLAAAVNLFDYLSEIDGFFVFVFLFLWTAGQPVLFYESSEFFFWIDMWSCEILVSSSFHALDEIMPEGI